MMHFNGRIVDSDPTSRLSLPVAQPARGQFSAVVTNRDEIPRLATSKEKDVTTAPETSTTDGPGTAPHPPIKFDQPEIPGGPQNEQDDVTTAQPSGARRRVKSGIGMKVAPRQTPDNGGTVENGGGTGPSGFGGGGFGLQTDATDEDGEAPQIPAFVWIIVSALLFGGS